MKRAEPAGPGARGPSASRVAELMKDKAVGRVMCVGEDAANF